jgi:hypothetical protein
VLRIVRDDGTGRSPHWVTATGRTYEDALASARHRIELYDASELT